MKINSTTVLASMLSLLSLSAFAGDIKITEATYGANDKTVDVTEQVKQLALPFGESPDYIIITPTNNLVKKDPAKKIPKTLLIKYTEDGTEKSKSIAERQTSFIGSGVNVTKDFSIIKAVYGGKDKWKDVTSLVEKFIKEPGIKQVDNISMGGDPAPKIPKKLAIYYSVNNKLYSKIMTETAKFDFSSLTQSQKK